jgi:hypothetical protein
MSGERPGPAPDDDAARQPWTPPPGHEGTREPWTPPPGGSPFPAPAPRRPIARHLLLGTLLGLVAGIGLPLVALRLDGMAGGTGGLFALGFVVPLGLAIALTVVPRTRLLGAGMFIGFGAALVVGAGVCVALLASMASA